MNQIYKDKEDFEAWAVKNVHSPFNSTDMLFPGMYTSPYMQQASNAWHAAVANERKKVENENERLLASNPDSCSTDVFEKGVSIGLFDIPKDVANEICAGISAVTGAQVDWHYIAGRVHIKAIPASLNPKPKES
jgi:hypothetical protein